MSDRKPSKPWRVYFGSTATSDHYRSERAAYEAVRTARAVAPDKRVTVYVWESGDWRLFERIRPDSA